MSAAPAGWYPQSDGSTRYWDGGQWVGMPQAAWPQDGAGPAAHPYGGRPTAYGQQPYAQPPYGAQPYGQPPYGQPGYPPSYAVGPVAPKNPGLSLLASFFIPGLGTMINGEVGKGVLILLLYFVSWPLVLVLIGIPMILGVWIWGMVDAYTGAQNWNRRYGIWS